MHATIASTPCKEAIVIRPGEIAPDFRLQDDRGQTVQLSALRGKPVVLFFYPQDETPRVARSNARSSATHARL